MKYTLKDIGKNALTAAIVVSILWGLGLLDIATASITDQVTYSNLYSPYTP